VTIIDEQALPRSPARAWSDRRGSELHTGGRWTVALEREDLITLIGHVAFRLSHFQITPYARIAEAKISYTVGSTMQSFSLCRGRMNRSSGCILDRSTHCRRSPHLLPEIVLDPTNPPAKRWICTDAS